ncbi:uncharacterized protein LOC113155384 isoform X2 [Anabas testudineus]|uniref:uncharacterized protein LOC113155384 isoform X2 n=1 Tax=Anabas testudineus TaxID=64144 RepID=UPI000E45A608|nr:uncharacterized protein LOC113155384 isoform X2 [Anabas testudineus]
MFIFSFNMTQHLLLVVLIYSCSKTKAQGLHPPSLTVNPPVTTETDSVTLTCQPPSSVSVTQCYFYFMRRKPAKTFSCLKRLTGSEILMMTNRNSSATVEVTCFYLVVYQSPESSMSSITIIHSPQTVGVPSDPDNSVSTFLTSVNPTPDTLTSADSSLLKPTSDDKIRETLIRMIGAVMIVVVVLLGLTILFNKIENCAFKRVPTAA